VHWRGMAERSALLVASDCASFVTPLLLQALLGCLEAGDSPGACCTLRTGMRRVPAPALHNAVRPQRCICVTKDQTAQECWS